MRVILVAMTLVLFFIITIPLDLILYLIGKSNWDKRMQITRSVVNFMFRLILWEAGAKITVSGQENIPDETALFVGNHQSYFDILSTYIFIPHGVGYVAKKEMKSIPFLNMWMNGIGCLFLDRENIKEGLKTILKGVDYIKNGCSMFIFPEGTRGPGDKLLPFKEGSLKMAERAKAPVVPVAISGTRNLLENNDSFKITPAKVHIQFGAPIYLDQLPKEERRKAGAYVQSVIETMLVEHQAL